MRGLAQKLIQPRRDKRVVGELRILHRQPRQRLALSGGELLVRVKGPGAAHEAMQAQHF